MCRTCGFTHPEASCPRWPADELDELEPMLEEFADSLGDYLKARDA